VHSVALLEVDGIVAWVGDASRAPDADVVLELGGALVTPAFVDGHVHATDTGLALAGLDLSGSSSKADVLEAVSRRTREVRGRAILGHGWDETAWAVREVPTASEIDRASYGSVVYLSRVDSHSALASNALMASVGALAGLDGYDAQGWLTREAHHAVRAAALGSVTPAQRRDAQGLMLRRAASLGIGAVHEMAGPEISGADDAADLLALAAAGPNPDVVLYWGQVAAEGGLEMMHDLGAHGAAGDLFVDGAVGSRTACLRSPYADQPATSGALFLDRDAVADHLVRCSEAGVQAGFHVIGDAAMDAVVGGLLLAAEQVGRDRFRALGHRLEHAEMLDGAQITTLADLRVVASVQPAFDAAWGGDHGMYVDRLGAQRGPALNPYADLLDAGVSLVLGSDSPVTPLDPWGAVRAAVHHRTPAQRIDVVAAFDAHTRAAHAAVGDHRTGTLTVGSPATYAVWAADFDQHGWPDLFPGGASPTCLRTVVRGTTVHDSGALEEVAA
jgi:predicted amidohydrolase YtcJ